MGELLAAEGLMPDVVLSSTAKRARKTATKVVKASGSSVEIELLRELYLAGPETYLAILRHQPDEHRCLLVVGHNPGLEELVYLLTGEHEAFPTAALAHVELGIESWMDLSLDASGKLKHLWRPRELP